MGRVGVEPTLFTARVTDLQSAVIATRHTYPSYYMVGTVSAALTTSPLSGECSTVELRSYMVTLCIPRTFRVSPTACITLTGFPVEV